MMQGFTEDLIINLSKFKGLSLLALESTSYIRGIEEVDAIAKLGADYTLGGSYRGHFRLEFGHSLLIIFPGFQVKNLIITTGMPWLPANYAPAAGMCQPMLTGLP